MKIILSPTAAFNDDNPPTVNGEEVTYRGVTFNVTDEELPEFAQFDGETLTLQYLYNCETAEDNQPVDWEQYTFDADKPITCPIVRRVVESSEEEFEPLEESDAD